MKKLLLICFSLLWVINCVFTQVYPEQQWLIWNNLGKNGVSGGTNNYTNTISNSLRLTHVSTPNSTLLGPPKNDLLVIYSNYEHYNTHNHVGVLEDFFEGVSSPVVSNHNFTIPAGMTIKYMYLTNIKEGDDPPELVTASTGSGPGSSNNLITTASSLLTSNHDVAIGTDITLIIHMDSILNYNKKNDIISINFGGIQSHGGGGPVSSLDFMDLQPIFGPSLSMSDLSTAVFPNQAISGPGSEEIILQPGNGYRYVNLRPNQNINGLLPDARSNTVNNDAVFILKQNGSEIKRLVEEIRLSHDPNFLQVESICLSNDGSYLVTYRLQFENDGDADAKTLGAEITFPAQFDLNCLKVKKWHAVGKSCNGKLTMNGSTCNFLFKDHRWLKSNKSNPRDSCIGYVTFIVAVNAGIDVRDPIVRLELGIPNVYFDNNPPYPVTLFYDLIKCDKDSTSNDSSLSQSDQKQAQEKKEKHDNVEQKKTEKVAQHDMDDKKAALSESGIESLHCYRPVSPIPCSCTGKLCIKCIVGAALLLGLLTFLFTRKRKKPTPPPPLES